MDFHPAVLPSLSGGRQKQGVSQCRRCFCHSRNSLHDIVLHVARNEQDFKWLGRVSHDTRLYLLLWPHRCRIMYV